MATTTNSSMSVNALKRAGSVAAPALPGAGPDVPSAAWFLVFSLFMAGSVKQWLDEEATFGSWPKGLSAVEKGAVYGLVFQHSWSSG